MWRDDFDKNLVGFAGSAVWRLRGLGGEGPWIAMATASGIQGYSVILSDNDATKPAWQDPSYLGEVFDEAMEPEALVPFGTCMWRRFGIDPTPRGG